MYLPYHCFPVAGPDLEVDTPLAQDLLQPWNMYFIIIFIILIYVVNIYIYRYVVYLQLWTLHTLFVTLLPPNRREAPPIYVSELPSQNKRACMMKVAVWRLTHLKDGPDNFQSSDWCVQHQVLLILGKWLELCVSCNRRSIFQLHKRHRSEKRTRPETNATKNPGQAMAVVAKRENYDGADGWIVVNYIF